MSQIDEVLAERGKVHGSFKEHARITTNLKLMAHNAKNWKDNNLSAIQMEAIDMVLHKLGRILAGDPRYLDHWVDLCGYATLVIKDLEAQRK